MPLFCRLALIFAVVAPRAIGANPAVRRDDPAGKPPNILLIVSDQHRPD